MAVIGHATINIVPNLKGFGKLLKGELDSGATKSAAGAAGESVGGSLMDGVKKMIGPAALIAGGLATAGFIKGAITAAGGLEQSMGAINTVFKDSATQVHTWAIGASSSVGLARDEYNNLAVLIGSQLKNAGVAMDELGPKTNNLVQAGADMASMFGGTTKEAVEAISSALKGERDPIERYGVTLNQAAVDAEAAALGFEKVGGSLSQEASAAATLSLIMKQTGDAHGNFAKEATTYEGVNQRLKASWDNIVATIGGGFLPFATAAKSILLEMMPGVQGLAENFQTFGEKMSAAFQGAGGGIEGVKAMFASIGDSIAAFVSGGGIEAAIEGFATFRDKAIAAILNALPAIVNAIVSMAPAILQGSLTSFASLVTGVIAVLPGVVSALAAMLPGIVSQLLSMIPSLLTAAVTAFLSIAQAVFAVLPEILTTIVGMLPGIVGAILGMLPVILTTAIELFMSLVNAVLAVLPELLIAIIDMLPVIITTILDMLPALLEAGIQIFFGLVTALVTVLPQLLVTLFAVVLPRLIITLLAMIPQLLMTAIKLFVALVTGLVENIVPLTRTIITEVIPAVVKALLNSGPQLVEAGKDLIRGLANGVGSMGDALWRSAQRVAQRALDAIKSFFGIRSPSRLMRKMGVHVGEGMVLGIDDMVRPVGDAAERMAGAVSAADIEPVTVGGRRLEDVQERVATELDIVARVRIDDSALRTYRPPAVDVRGEVRPELGKALD